MDNFVVSARKYRPDSFETVVGQLSITRTLKNAINTNHIAHAYLFCGPRGVGKTTCARIFAKNINCFNPDENSEACNACESCESFNDNRSFNIHELDAASNNHVDDIRNLIDQVRVPPQVGKYSIYIIDEVHMLSQQAFNAFLKTLEEPPAHAVFILATTEKHKIIPTILSRCQIFDFKRITIKETMEYLGNVASKESVQIDSTALNIIAQKADGSMRDALSIFDQVVSFSGKVVDYKAIIENLNVLDYKYFFTMTKAFLEGDYSRALLVFDEILENGFDARNYLNGMGKHMRDLLMCKDEETIPLMELNGDIANDYKSFAQGCSVGFLFKALSIINEADINYKTAKDTRLHLEIALMKLSSILKAPGELNTKHTTENTVAEVAGVKPSIPENKTPATKEPIPEVKAEKNPEIKAEPPAESEKNTESKQDSIEPAENENKETVDIKPAPATSIKTGPRIKDYLRKTQESSVESTETEKVPVEITGDELIPLNQENLELLWHKFAEEIKEDQPRLFNTLTTQKPILEENNMVRIDLNNPLQEKALASIQHEIIGYLKRNTGIPDIDINRLVPTKNTDKKLYTVEDKFKHMQEGNPQLGLFKNTFNLDFE